jgi:hypothetical protein
LAEVLFNEPVSKGAHVYTVDQRSLAPGYYILAMSSKWFIGRQQIVVME